MSDLGASSVVPPLPADIVYTHCYCEENVYLLAQVFQEQAERDSDWAWDVHVIVISNDGKTVVLWNPKTAGKDSVVWDYHVVLALLPRGRPGALDEGEVSAGSRRAAWVYDFDTRLPLPCRWLEYMSGTFPYAFSTELAREVPDAYRCLFRVIPARDFLDYFASDRSHMLVHAQTDGPVSTGAPSVCDEPATSSLPPLSGAQDRMIY